MTKVSRSQHFIKFLVLMGKAGITRDKAIRHYLAFGEVEIIEPSVEESDSSGKPEGFSCSSEKFYPRDD